MRADTRNAGRQNGKLSAVVPRGAGFVLEDEESRTERCRREARRGPRVETPLVAREVGAPRRRGS